MIVNVVVFIDTRLPHGVDVLGEKSATVVFAVFEGLLSGSLPVVGGADGFLGDVTGGVILKFGLLHQTVLRMAAVIGEFEDGFDKMGLVAIVIEDLVMADILIVAFAVEGLGNGIRPIDSPVGIVIGIISRLGDLLEFAETGETVVGV